MDSCCWKKDELTPEECPFLREGEDALRFDRRRRLVERCIECPRFLQELPEGNGVAGVLPLLIGELLVQKAQVQTLASQVEARNREFGFVHDVNLVLQGSIDSNEVIAMALTAITAGKGFGFNRALLLLVDKGGSWLRGHTAVGPSGAEEAGRIWHELEERNESLKEMAQRFLEQKMVAEREKFAALLGGLSVPLERSGHLFVRVLQEGTTRHVRDLWQEGGVDPEQTQALAVGELVLVPLVCKARRIGLLLADNCINHRPIGSGDIHLLETFAVPVSFAIERAALYERLQEELDNLSEAHVRLLEQQGMIARMERMAVLGHIAADLTHSVRNPLTIIGGYARKLLKQTAVDDPRRRPLEAVVREARRLEEAVQDVLAQSEAQHPSFDLWDINRILAGVYAGLREDLALCGIDCRLELEPGLPPVPLDFRKMSHCLRFLLNRAIEAMPDGGRLTVNSRQDGEELVVCISDSGAGMSREEVATVFAPLFSGRGEGHAVGLTLCARVLEEHQAHFSIDSREGEGTTFCIRLKLTREETHGTTAGG